MATLVERWWNIPPIPTSQTSLTWAYGGVGGPTGNLGPRPVVMESGWSGLRRISGSYFLQGKGVGRGPQFRLRSHNVRKQKDQSPVVNGRRFEVKMEVEVARILIDGVDQQEANSDDLRYFDALRDEVFEEGWP